MKAIAYIDGFNLVLMKMVHGTFTRLASTQFAAKASTSYTVRFKVTGRTLSARVWQTSSSEPSKWMVSATDSSFTSGNCGIVIYLQNGVTAKITSFRATSA